MELEIIRFIQSFASPILDVFFMLITMLGEEVFIIFIALYIYWCYDKEYGEYFGYSVFTSFAANNLIKDVFKFKRPIGEWGIVSKAVKKATGYSFPSGHTQMSATALSALCVIIRKRFIYILSGILIVLVGVSRLYLGVHYPKDVIVGGILGIILPIIFAVIIDKFKDIKTISLITLIPIVSYSFFAQSADYFKGLGLYIGFVLGLYVEQKFIKFQIPQKRSKKILRIVLGVIIVGIIKISLGNILQDTTYFILLEYGIISFSIIGIIPKLFTIIRI